MLEVVFLGELELHGVELVIELLVVVVVLDGGEFGVALFVLDLVVVVGDYFGVGVVGLVGGGDETVVVSAWCGVFPRAFSHG